MTATEPADGGYVVLTPHLQPDATLIYRRSDERAAAGDAHWFNRADGGEPARTWEQLVDLGPILYVGEVVNR